MAGLSKSDWRPLSRLAHNALSLVAVLVFIVMWAIFAKLKLVEPLFLPSPGTGMVPGCGLGPEGQVPLGLIVKLRRIFRALLLTVAVGVPLGILIGSLPAVDSVFEPFLQPMRYLPITALL